MIKKCSKCGKEFERKNNSRVNWCKSCVNDYQNKKKVEKSKKEFEDADADTFVVCQICGLHSANISTHLRRIHDMSSEDYQKTYNLPVMSKKLTEEFSERVKGSNNPAYQHGGKFSPFSKNFIKGDVRKETLEKAKNSKEENCGYTTRLDYYTSRGYSEEEAQKALSERQTTFSKEICIEKYGEEEGLKVWKERQKKWLKSLSKKPDGLEYLDEIDISKLKDSKDYQIYRTKIQNLSRKTYKEFKEFIDPSNLLESQNNYEIDHKVSRLEGFLNDVEPEIMSCKYNLQVLSREENLKKGATSSITIEELNNLYYNSI